MKKFLLSTFLVLMTLVPSIGHTTGLCRILFDRPTVSDIGLVSLTPSISERADRAKVVELAREAAVQAEPSVAKQLFNSIKQRVKAAVLFDSIRLAVTDYTNRIFVTRTYEGRNGDSSQNVPVTMELGSRLGFGMHGGVYSIKRLHYGSENYTAEGLVAKVPHTIKGMSHPMKGPEKGNREEVMVYKLIRDWLPGTISKVEATPGYPQSPAWARGSLPIIPILASFSVNGVGTTMIKPLIRGWGLKQIFERYGDKLPPEMLSDLQGMHGMMLAVNQHIDTLVKKGVETRVLDGIRDALDANPRNLVWIPKEEVANLRALGVQIEREGFYLIEFALRMSAGSNEKSWSQYLENFYKDLRQFGAGGLE